MRNVHSHLHDASGIIDRHLGSAYKVVLEVRERLEDILRVFEKLPEFEHFNTHIEDIILVAESLDKIETIIPYLDSLQEVINAIDGALITTNNLSDLDNVDEALSNLGLKDLGGLI